MAIKDYSRSRIGSWRAPGAIIPTFFTIIPTFFSRAALALAFVCSLAAPLLAMPGDPSRLRLGLRNSPGPDKLSVAQLDILVRSLRERAGFLELRFDEDGFLTLGDRTRIAGGSATARALLVATVDGSNVILLRNRPRSSEVAFARLVASSTYTNASTETRIDSCLLEIDFHDFAQLRGEREVMAAFDPGFATLHELGHAVLALKDDRTSAQGLGGCEMHINRIRRELGLPERQRYSARARQTAHGARVAELLFIQRKQGEPRWFYLSWEIDRVGRQVGQVVERARPADHIMVTLRGDETPDFSLNAGLVGKAKKSRRHEHFSMPATPS